MLRSRRIRLLTPAALLASLAACFPAQQHNATSVVSYLYPGRRDPIETPSVPTLELPLRVGVAFVPGSAGSACAAICDNGIAEADRFALLSRVADHFKDSTFVKSIEIIPTQYLTPGGGFTNLEQLRRMFGIDVIALVSYDQVQFSNDRKLTLTYWTVVGAYLVNGEHNETRTLLDAVVYDIPSHKLLFRAPGVSSVKGSSSMVDFQLRQRHDSEEGFRLAADELIANLDKQLPVFREKVRSRPSEYHVVELPEYRGGTRGGGSADGWTVALAAALGVAGAFGGRRRRAGS